MHSSLEILCQHLVLLLVVPGAGVSFYWRPENRYGTQISSNNDPLILTSQIIVHCYLILEDNA